MRERMTQAAIAVLMAVAGTADAAEFEVRMLNRGTEGAVARVVAATPGNPAEAKAVPQAGKEKQAFAALFEELPTQAAAAQ